MARPIAFLDESGDESGKLSKGASRLYVVGLVVFLDKAEAAACGERIDGLRREIGKGERYEFHFTKNSKNVRVAFLRAVAPFAFTYHAVVIEKRESRAAHIPLYLEACSRVCGLAGKDLNQAVLFADEYSRHSESEIRQRVNLGANRFALSEVRMQVSARNNLIQLADYIAGVRRYSAEDNRDAAEYCRILTKREGRIDRRPMD